MNNEFKKIKSGNDTRYILESASVGSVSVSAVDTGLASPMGAVHRRAGDNLINQENKKSFKMPKRPNNPVAKAHQSIGTGSGEHKKDKNVLARKEKHKKPPELGEAAYTGDYDTDEKNIQHLMRKYHWTRQEAEEHLTSSDSDDEQFNEANIDPEARYTPSPAKPFRNPPGFNKQGTGVGNRLAQQTRAELAKKKQPGVAEGEDDDVEHLANTFADLYWSGKIGMTSATEKVKMAHKIIQAVEDGRLSIEELKQDISDLDQGVAEGQTTRTCPQCDGSGEDTLDPTKSCRRCGGKGYIPMPKEPGVAEAQLDELSPETLKSYIKKSKGHSQKYDQLGNKADEKGDEELANKMWNKGDNRYAGDAQARNKLADLKDKKKGVAEGAETPGGQQTEIDPGKYYVWAWDGAVVVYGKYDTAQDAERNLPAIEQAAIKRVGSYVRGAFKVASGRSLLAKYLDKQGVAEDAYTEELKSKLAEKLSPQDPDGVWIDDFEKADPNKYRQFKNKSPVKKRQMALAAHRDSLKTK